MDTPRLTIDKATLTPVVRRVLDSDSVEVVDWSYLPLHGGVVTYLTGGGVFLFRGTCLDRGETVPWRVVLKIAPPFGDQAKHDEPASPCYWKRELLVYESNLLAMLPNGLTAPRCFGSRVLEGSTTWLWLEYVEDVVGSHWPLERYGLAARHLGRLNGQFLTDRPLPDVPWLARRGLRQEQESSRGSSFIAEIRVALEQGRVHEDLSPLLCEGLLAVLERQDDLLSALDRLPQTLGHRETFRRNLLARRDALGNDQTVLIDWTHLGIGPLGEDLSSLVFNTILLCDVEARDFRELAELAYQGYLDGLRDVGWTGDARSIRLGYCATAALRFSLHLATLVFASEMPEDPRRMLEGFTRRPLAETRANILEVYRQALECAREAKGLVASLW